MNAALRRAVFGMIVALGIGCGCASMTDDGSGPASSSDASLSGTIRERLQADSVTSPYVFGITVHRGFAVLQGQVPDNGVRIRALNVARGTPGVIEVQDRIQSVENPMGSAGQVRSMGGRW